MGSLRRGRFGDVLTPPHHGVGMLWGACPPGMQETRRAAHAGPHQAFMAF